MSYLEITDSAQSAYASLAPYYDRFTVDYAYERWLSRIEERARTLGLAGRRLLDVACGTGNSFAPLLARGYDVTACDISAEMVDRAEHKFADRVHDIFVADMRQLPELGRFDLVTCLDDAINYLLSQKELEEAFASVARVLEPDGVYVFDVNSLKAYRTVGSQTFLREDAGAVFCWRGEGVAPIEPGDEVSATIDAFIQTDEVSWLRASSRHVQRHHPPEAIHDALAAAGLRCAAVAGQRPGGHLDDEFDEMEHMKVVYFARRRGDREGVI